ncbi:unnamed protein product [Parnassius mnemosyne]|uniref:Uncharacterized protein n=1 Tax=Parnassius mnemosyne TaxID=213953 RepID=A0AAV1MD35_9NEOP
MSDDFIPLNQSTPVHERWAGRIQNQNSFQNNRHQNYQRRRGHNYNNRWGNNSSRSSFGSDSNSSYGRDSKSNIDAYLHPSMLQDPWAQLRQRKEVSNT